MTVRAICTDIDGTLLDKRRELSEKTKEIFTKVAAAIPVILASSRMPSAMTHLQAELGILHHPIIAYNGGYVIRFSKNENALQVFDSVTIPVGVCRSIYSMVTKTAVHASLYHEDNWYAPQMDEWTEREERITKVKAIISSPSGVFDEWESKNLGAHKIMCMGRADEIRELHKQLNEIHGRDIHVYLSRPTYIEIAPKSISKGSALKLILEKQFNISVSDALAFGDNYNDIEMLKLAGRGIAVLNSREEVKAIADELTGNSFDDGVAVAIEKYYLSPQQVR